MTYRDFTLRLHGICRDVLARNSHGRTLPAYLHVAHQDGRVESMHVGLGGTREERAELVRTAVAPYVASLVPAIVGWTFEGERDGQPLAVTVTVDRERAETWFAYLYRPPEADETLIGQFRVWPVPPEDQAGTLITPIQEAMR
jgi:hypothetical protein